MHNTTKCTREGLHLNQKDKKKKKKNQSINMKTIAVEKKMSTWRQDIVKREKNKTLIKTVIDKPKSWCSRVGVVKI